MSWLNGYREDITALEQAKDDAIPINFEDAEQFNLFIEGFNKELERFREGHSESELAEVIFSFFSQSFKESEMRAAKKEVAILCRLTPLFERLLTASESEWEEYQQIRLKARMSSKVMQRFFKMMMHSDLHEEPPQIDQEGLS